MSMRHIRQTESWLTLTLRSFTQPWPRSLPLTKLPNLSLCQSQRVNFSSLTNFIATPLSITDIPSHKYTRSVSVDPLYLCSWDRLVRFPSLAFRLSVCLPLPARSCNFKATRSAFFSSSSSSSLYRGTQFGLPWVSVVFLYLRVFYSLVYVH